MSLKKINKKKLLLFSQLPSLENLNNDVLTIERDLFLTVLLSNLKNETITYQTELRKLKFVNKKALTLQLGTLKRDTTKNFNEIIKIEHKLSQIIEEEIDERLKDNKKFQNLRFEKNSGAFNKIFQASKNGSNINLIREKNGANFTDFDNIKARDEYIKGFYGKIYEKQNVNITSIDDFLGDEILNNPEVINKKLTEPEKMFFDNELTLAELEKSLKTANLSSAPGLDGLNNKALKIFWPDIKFAILSGLKLMIEKEELTDLLKLGGIRLIPKKGELENIYNW